MPPDPSPPSVIVQRPGDMRHDPDYPNEDRWTFQVTVNGEAGVYSAFFPMGTSESVAAGMVQQVLTSEPGTMKGITSTGGAGGMGGATGGSPGPAGAGWTGTGPTIDLDDENDDIPKMKTEDGT